MTRLEQMIFAIFEAKDHRAELKKVLKDPALSVNSIADLNPQALHDQGVRVVIFDFDGVLAPHDHLTLTETDLAQLRVFCDIFEQTNIFIWSNNPIPARMRWLQEQFPHIVWLEGEQKPSPDCLQQLIQTKNYEPKTVLMIDDRLLTGVLAGILAGTQVRLIKKAKVRLKGNLKAESGFILLRWVERMVFRF